MLKPIRIPKWLIGVGAVLLLLVIGTSSVLVMSQNTQPQSDDPLQHLAAARERWQANPIDHYRMVLTREGPYIVATERSVEVRQGDVLQSAGNAFDLPPRPDGLFNYIERLYDQYDGTCGPNGCRCDGVYDLSVTYNDERGYPEQMALELQRNDIAYWITRLSEGCTETSAFEWEMTIVLLPIQE